MKRKMGLRDYYRSGFSFVHQDFGKEVGGSVGRLGSTLKAKNI